MLTKCSFSSGTSCPKFIPHFPDSPLFVDPKLGLSQNVVGNGKPFQCRWIDCKSTGFDSQIGLVAHIERSHVETRREDFSCFWLGCSRRNRPFNARYKLLIHLRIHSGHKPNKCTFEDCDKAFSRLENLKIHLRSHTGERPYVCTNPFCSKSFSNSSDRAKHQRTHIDKKPYACTWPGCAKRYTDPSSLRKHAKIHLNPEAHANSRSRVPRKQKFVKFEADWSEAPITSSVFLTPSPTPSSTTFDKTFEFPEVGTEQLGPGLSSELYPSCTGLGKDVDTDYFDTMIKSEYYSPDLNAYYNDLDWMLYFELRDVEAILGD